jgi:NiFe hydrogenase small subunit HydA
MLDDLLDARGMTRRDFLKSCGTLAVLLGLGQTAAPSIARALEDAAARPSVIWLDFQECLGCTESLTKSRYPDFVDVVLDLISLNYSEAVQAAAGKQAEAVLRKTMEEQRGAYVLVVEGSVATKIPNAMCVGGRQSVDIAREALEGAAVVIAAGNCAAFGNVQAAHPNPTGAMGMLAFMQQEGMDTSKLVQLTTCPVNPVHVTGAITYFLTYKELPPVDEWSRPTLWYGRRLHDDCPRRAHFDEGRFVEQLAGPGETEGYCLYKMGCRGPHTFCDCPTVLWNNRSNWCIGTGQCIGCAEKDYWDEFRDLYSPMPDVDIPGIGGVRVDADTVGIGLAAVTGAAIVGHLGLTVAKGRLGKAEEPAVLEEREV